MCLLTGSAPALWGQCNPSGNPSRYEFDIDPTAMINIMGQQFCTSQTVGTNCCGAQPSYRCLDLVFNLENGPMGQTFGENCQGLINLMTSNGNFDALFFNVGNPDPGGSATDCTSPINIGNNYFISVVFSGTNMGQVEAELTVVDNMGNVVYNSMEVADPGQAVILTICKPGFGCVEDEFIFGCCNASGALALAPGAPEAICAGDTSYLKVTGLNGVPPYTVSVRAASASDTTYFDVVVPDDMDGNSTMDMITIPVIPDETTIYTAVSVLDGADCAKPIFDQADTVTVVPVPTIDPVPDLTVCAGTDVGPILFSGTPAGVEFDWVNDNISIGLGASGSGDISAFTALNAGTTEEVATITVTPSVTANGITCTGTAATFMIRVLPLPAVDPVADQTYCVEASVPQIDFASNVPGAAIGWTRTPESIGLTDLSGGAFVPAFSTVNAGTDPLVSTFTVQASVSSGDSTCTGPPTEFSITVNPVPTVDPVTDQTVCAGDMTAPVSFTGAVPGTVFDWVNDNTTIGLAASGSGDIAAFVAVNAGNTPEVGTVTVTPVFTNNNVVCPGATAQFAITVNPVPTVEPVSNQQVCAGNSTALITFSSPVPGTVFEWTNDNPGIGLAASGSGNIPAFVAVNAGNAPEVATITVTPVFSNNNTDCPGASVQFTISVNPVPTVDPVTDQTVCAGTMTAPVIFSGAVPGTVYNWTNNNTTIGLVAAGSGDIPAFTALNAGTTPEVATIIVTPSYTNNDFTCEGGTTSFSITVNPVPAVDPISDQVVCDGASTAEVVFSGPVPGTVFSWTNDEPSIGLAASGSGDIPAFNAVNNGVTPVTATITVTPTFSDNGVDCPGGSVTFTITVGPVPTVDPVSNQEVCSDDQVAPISFTGSVPGTVYNWVNDNPSIGLAAAGSGNIAAFTALNAGNTIQVATITVTPQFDDGDVSCTGDPVQFTITVYPRPGVFAGNDQIICQNQLVNLAASLSGGATGGTWSGGQGAFGNPSSPITTYTPNPAEYGTTFELVFTTNDPAGPCPAAVDAILVTVNTLPVVHAGADVMICQGDDLDLSKLNASILSNGSGVTTGTWSSSGSGIFQPTNAFPGAQFYVPSMADRMNGAVALTLTSADPPGPCSPVQDQVLLYFQPFDGLVCNDNVMIALDGDGMVEILPDMILEGTYVDSMFTVDVFVNGVSIGNKVDCSHIGMTLMVRVTDNCTGVFCMGTIIVKDNLNPKLICKDIELICPVTDLSPAYLLDVLGIDDAYPMVNENCLINSLTYHDTWVDLTCDDDYVGYAQRVWKVTDGSGNTGTCVQYINFVHQYITDVKFPEDVTLYCTGGPANTDPQATGAPYLTAFDLDWPIYPDAGFCRLSATYTDNVVWSCDGTYDIIRTWLVYDMCSPTTPMPPSTNPKYYIQIIKVIDNTGPEFVCPDDLTVSTDPLACCATTDLPDIVATDICSRIKSAFARVEVYDPITHTLLDTYDVPGVISDFPGNIPSDPDTLVSFGYTPCLPLGTHTVTLTVEDDCGNASTCSYQLTVSDLTPPVPACDEITQVALGIDGMALINATTFDDGSYDNCNPVYFKARRYEVNTCQDYDQFYDQVKFCCEDINDTILVILRVYDVPVPPGPVSLSFEEEHSNECQVQVYVEDKIKPSCIAPDNVTVSCENFDPSLWAYGFADGVDNCALDTILVTTSYSLFDTVCNKGTIVRTFRTVDHGGKSSQCTQRIYVTYEQDYFVRFPNDVILTECDGVQSYGEPEFYGKDCELIGVSFEDEVFTVVPDACYKIERTWTVINWCTFDPNAPCTVVPNPNPNSISHHPSNLVGPTVSAPGTAAPWAPTIVKINPNDPTPTNYSIYWSANANCYKYKQIIKIIDNEKPNIFCPDSPVEVCDLSDNDTQLWNESYWYDAMTGSHDLCEAPSDLCIAASDACSQTNVTVRYLLFLDLDNNGDMETVISSTNPPPPNTVMYNNIGTPNYTGGTARAFDSRVVPLNQKYQFTLQTEVNGQFVNACVRWNTQSNPTNYVVPELPYGTHKIKWFVTDGCGNENVCEYTFVVKDCKPPSVVCMNGLSVNMMPTGMIQVDVEYFIEDSYDNCSPSDMLVHGIRWANTGTGFPFNPDGTPVTSYTFDCSELGLNLMEVWSMDLAGNADFCSTYIQVQDNAGVCSQDAASVAGLLLTENDSGLEDVQVQVKGTAPGGQAPVNLISTTDNLGHFMFQNAVPYAADAEIIPYKDNDPLNGVSTFDLVLINKHILGLEPLNTPYKMIAADANNSRSVTTYDIVELRKLILGIYTELPANTSWRFVDKTYQFPNPYNPFQDIFPEKKVLADIQTNMMDEDFVAVKTGDVNGNAVTSSMQFSEDRSEGQVLFDLEDRLVSPGERFTIELRADRALAGFQFTLYHPGLVLQDVQSGSGLKTENFGIFPEEHALTVSYHNRDGRTNPDVFTLTFSAETSGMLSKMLSISSQITRAEAYAYGPDTDGTNHNDALETWNLGLRFTGEDAVLISGVGFELYQNQPNPWINRTRIGFHLPSDMEATLRVFDETGRELYRKKAMYNRGYNMVSIDNSLLRASGLLYYKLETTTNSAVRKMIRIH
ncbi:MAG: hypothetical protein EP344_02220 [Bacteroidetes bacterium]|nr:MAG: hypothetical protein EP344_02220 [Bacteroidota bacterium]